MPIVTAKETFSAGDAMRDIYTHGIISSDFILVTGDLVSNIRIDEVVREHKERRKTNKDAIMTMVVKQSGASHRSRRVCWFNIVPFEGYVADSFRYRTFVDPEESLPSSC
jgi:NDP-sugar pyrophosphorylase family protein